MARFTALIVAVFASSVTGFVPNLNHNVGTKSSWAVAPRPHAAPQTGTTSTSLFETRRLLKQTELPDKLYFEQAKELPKVLGGLKIGTRKLVVITGASSGLGRKAAAVLAKTGKYFVVMACRDVEKAKKVAIEEEMPEGSYTVMKLELGNLQSVRDFVANLKAFKSARPLTHLICNAAVYRPTDPEPAWTDDGFEMSMVRSRSVASK